MTSANLPLVLEELLGRCMGDHEFASSILHSFLDSCDDQLSEIVAQCEAGNGDEVARLAHRFKGTAATLAAGPLKETMISIEQMVRDHELGTIDAEFTRARSEIVRLREFASQNLFQNEPKAT